MVDYENEMEVLVLTRIHDDGDATKATVYLHDNDTGELLKEIPLEEPWEEVGFTTELYNKDFKKASVQNREWLGAETIVPKKASFRSWQCAFTHRLPVPGWLL